MSPDDIFKCCQEIQEFLESHYNADVADAAVDRMTTAEAYMSLSAKMLADAKYHLREIEESSIIEGTTKAIAGKWATTTTNKYIDSLTRDYGYLVDWTERQNRACTHCIDSCRTIISKLKEESRLAGYSGR